MAETSKIEWTDATWNPITGCTMVSAGCTNCYAMGLAATRLRNHPSRTGLTRVTGGRPVWTGEVRLNEQWLDQPLRWKRPRRIFVCAHGDLFHENVPDDWIDRVFAVMALTPRHTFQVLTKRPERARYHIQKLTDDCPADRLADIAGSHLGEEADAWVANYINGWSRPIEANDGNPADGTVQRWPLPNVWLGTSVEDQTTADARIPDLLATPAAVRLVSAEPLLGPVDLRHIWVEEGEAAAIVNALSVTPISDAYGWAALDWVIVGGESGPNARPMHPDWARSLRDQCQAAGVAFHFKQWGEWAPDDGPGPDGRDRILAGQCKAAHHDGINWHFADHGFAIDTDAAHAHPEWVYRTGKRAAGRLLDGRTWDEFPL